LESARSRRQRVAELSLGFAVCARRASAVSHRFACFARPDLHDVLDDVEADCGCAVEAVREHFTENATVDLPQFCLFDASVGSDDCVEDRVRALERGQRTQLIEIEA
jgi:hypothetical protein